jgi:hypothetical protein
LVGVIVPGVRLKSVVKLTVVVVEVSVESLVVKSVLIVVMEVLPIVKVPYVPFGASVVNGSDEK